MVGEVVEAKMESAGRQLSLYGFEMRDVDNRRTGRESIHDIKQLWQRSHEIIGLALQGMKNTEIAKILGITPQTVSNTLNSTLGREKLSDMREERDEHYVEVSKQVRELTIKALAVYRNLFDSPSVDPELRKKTADTVTLDIAGMRAPTKVDTRTLHAHATIEEINDFKRRGLEAIKEAGYSTQQEEA